MTENMKDKIIIGDFHIEKKDGDILLSIDGFKPLKIGQNKTNKISKGILELIGYKWTRISSVGLLTNDNIEIWLQGLNQNDRKRIVLSIISNYYPLFTLSDIEVY